MVTKMKRQWRKGLIRALTGSCLATVALTGTAMAQQLDFTDPNDAITINRKIQCSLVDGEPTVFHWVGRVYSRRQGERDRHIMNVHGMNVRTCGTVEDPEKGTGYKMVSREIMLYLDPETNEILRTWDNPFTGETVDVVHVANDPVNSRAPTFPVGRGGKPLSLDARVANGLFYYNIEVPLFYTNPLAGDYQDYVGNHYHAMEMFNFIGDADGLLSTDPEDDYLLAVSWVRLAQWLPWMKMGSRPGLMVVNATGSRLDSFEDLPDFVKAEIRQNYPEYTSPPPLDDPRPNDTSWTVFKRYLEEKGETPKNSGH